MTHHTPLFARNPRKICFVGGKNFAAKCNVQIFATPADRLAVVPRHALAVAIEVAEIGLGEDIAWCARVDAEPVLDLAELADHGDGRGRQDRPPLGLVVERNVA